MSNEKQSPEMLPKALVREIAKVASEAAAKEYAEQQKAAAAAFKDKRLHNTKLLVRKYTMLRDYCNNAIYDTAQLCSEENDNVLALLGVELGERHQVGSIRNNVIKTRVIMDHVDTMLDCYQRRCMASSKPEIKRRWRVLQKMYLEDSPMVAQDIADQEHVSISLIYQDIDNACEELSPLFFGLDLSEFWL